MASQPPSLPRSSATAHDERIAAVRHFNRFYTRAIGVLQDGLLDSPYSLTEARVLWELAHHAPLTATDLTRELSLDAGYMSRLLRRLKDQGLVKAQTSRTDGRQQMLTLTAKGRRAFAPLDQRSHAQTAQLLGQLDDDSQCHLIDAMHRIEAALQPAQTDAAVRSQPDWVLRPPRCGDMGWVISRHGALYAQEYGWDMRFEALVARICADFVDHFEPQREACWIAEQGGRNVGSVFLVQSTATIAQLRMLIVDPCARGHGIGAALIAHCEQFARERGYRKIRLWTNSILDAARHLYEKAGYRKVKEEAHHSFGHDLTGETWELKL